MPQDFNVPSLELARISRTLSFQLRCLIHGGRPAPFISLSVGGLDQEKIKDDTQSQEPNEDGVYETVQVC